MINQLSTLDVRDTPTYKSLFKKRAMLVLVVDIDQPGFDRNRVA